jgi:hypothetical protein
VTTLYFPAALLNLDAVIDNPNRVTLSWMNNADNHALHGAVTGSLDHF